MNTSSGRPQGDPPSFEVKKRPRARRQLKKYRSLVLLNEDTFLAQQRSYGPLFYFKKKRPDVTNSLRRSLDSPSLKSPSVRSFFATNYFLPFFFATFFLAVFLVTFFFATFFAFLTNVRPPPKNERY